MYIGGVGGAANGIFIDTGLFKRLDIVCVLTVTCIRKYHEIYYIYIHVCLSVCVCVCVCAKLKLRPQIKLAIKVECYGNFSN